VIAMSMLAVERIKLFTTRSPWWCLALATVIMIGFAALFTALSGSEEFPLTVGTTQVGYGFALNVILVMAAIAITSEYRFGTIKATFMAVPNRTAALLAKATVVALVSGVLGELIAFGAYGVGRLIKPNADLAINTATEWRYVAGVGLVFALSAVIAVSVGALVRQTAGAVSILLVWIMLVEGLVGLIPKVGDDIQRWLPWMQANHFLTAGNGEAAGEGNGVGLQMPFGPWGALAYFAGVTAALLVLAAITVERRDA
jgi:ABC-2 type transport system permease protein